MGQNQSYPDGTSTAIPGESDCSSSGNQMSGASEMSDDAAARDGVDKRMVAINQAQSVRAAIDTLIESCLVAKDDGMNGETVKAPAVGYSLEQLTNLKEDPGNDKKTGSDEKKPSVKREADSKTSSKDRDDDSTPKTFGSLMEKSIIELIKKGDDEQEELAMIGSQNQDEKAAEGSVKCDKKNSPGGLTRSAVGGGGSDNTANSSKTNSQKQQQQTAPVAQAKRTVRLQTLIDTVLDNSLAHDMPSSFEKRKNDALINDLMMGRSDSTSKNVTPPKPSQTKTYKATTTTTTAAAASDMKENKMIYLMDHIEKVLERNFEASNEESDDDSNLQILSRLSWDSPPASTSIPTHNTESSPRMKQSENQSRASSGSNCSEGTISVQDIVDRVISQTEVISKLLSPSDSAATSRAGKEAYKEAGKNSTAASGGGGSSNQQQQQQQQAVSQVSSKLTEQSRSPQSRPSSGSHLMEGHTSKMSEHANSRGRPRASTYDSHQMWNLRHAQETRSAIARSLEKSPQEYRQLDMATTSGSEGLHSMSKNNGKSVPSPGYGAGPLVLPPYMNSLVPTSGIISFAQSPVFRPPGHQMFVPRYPVPMLRVDMPSDGPQALPPHPPTASCACVACKFHMEEHSPKHGLLGPVSPSSSGGMLSPHGQVDSSYYQQRLTGQLLQAGPGQHNPYMMRDYSSRPSSNSPGRHPIPNAPPQMSPIANNKQQQGVGQTQKTVHYPPSVPMGGLPRDSEFHGYTSYEKQKLEMLKSERTSYHSQHLPQISVQNPFETPRTDVYSGVDPSFLVGRLDPGLQRNEDFGRGSNYEHSVDKRLQSLPPRTSPAQVAMHDESRRERGHAPSQILDLTVKNEARAHVERAPSGCEPVEEPSDEPLDLSKKSPASGTFTSDHVKRLQQIHTPKTEPVGFRKPDPGMKLEVSSKPPHHQPQVDGNARYSHSQSKEVHPYPGAAAPSVFGMNSRVPGPAEMAPTVNPNMLISPGGQRPQLHPLPAPSLATSLMPSSSSSSSAVMLQTYMAHAAAAANHSLPPSVMDQRDKLTIPGQQKSKSSESVLKPQRESPQLDSPDNLEKGDIATRRNSTGRNEPIQSIIGNHNPNDILYLICRICRQSNGSPYAFRKHFRNHHGFEPKAEHTIVQTISATKSARQNPYASNGPEADCGIEPGQNAEERNAMERSQNLPKDSQGSFSESFPLESSPQNTEVGHKSKNYSSGSSSSSSRSADGKQGVVKDNREDTKYLECPECKQTFQLNDFGSYKRHCRQHNQSRGSGSFIAPELADSQDPVDKMQGGITMCKICGVPFSVHYIEDHVRSAHGYFCSQCPDVFKTCDDLQLHTRSTHSSNFLPTASPSMPAASPGIRLSPRIHSPSHASLPSNSPSLSNSPHHRSPSRTGGVVSASTPSPSSNMSQKANRNNMHSSPSDPPGPCVPSSKPGAVAAVTPSGRVQSAAESVHNYGPISSTCEIERMPADNLTISASPDSSSDNVAKCSASVGVVSDVTVSCSLTSRDTPEDRNKVVSSVKSSSSSKMKADDDMDSTVSGSPSSDMIIDIPASDGDVQNFSYKHKKFGGHRKRAESSDGSEVSAKVMKHGKDDSSSGQNVNEDSSSSSCGSYKSTDGEKQAGDDRVLTKEKNNVVMQTKSKVDGRIKQEARHQLPFVWDRVTRIQAGKNIKPPDYMT